MYRLAEKKVKSVLAIRQVCTDVTMCVMYRCEFIMDRDSSVGIATHYRLDGPDIESR